MASNSCTASFSCFGLSAVTSRIGRLCNVDLPILPLPGCCLFACHQYSKMPMDVFAHRTNAFSCSVDESRIDNYARPPMVLRGVNCIPVDWPVKRKSRFQRQCDAGD